MTEHERQHRHEYYLKNRERILARMKDYHRAHKEEIAYCQKLYKNYPRVEYCRMMIRRWEKKLKEAKTDENENL